MPMRYSVTLIVDPGGSDLVPGDERLGRALGDFGDVDSAPVFGANEIEVDIEVHTVSLLGAVSDATSTLERGLGRIAGDPRPAIVRIDAHRAP
jgi:hypothetical protein